MTMLLVWRGKVTIFALKGKAFQFNIKVGDEI